ncbi:MULTISPECIES: family 16 glycosylhydrolase [unclassified Caulobacter]|uniref:family 16 glycosylhydrolase n=1 Tax=unclassified Caulobacter TaxID=2648921 RepID=UPI000D39452C|nr:MULTISPECIES: family 16 glycosylhydrolase [unclassified Caulobacter]PTS81665.1 hypothetical protein DBR21_19000 [Caulobacter sp. HMWF009]PTT04635.1 hypothetical protein DBR10_18100 [Caulobacter sp. HMWF025]
MAATVYRDYAGTVLAQSKGPLALVLGTAANDFLTGSAAADAFQASAGVDTLVGGLGDDTYIVQNSAGRVIEAAGGGIDTVKTTTHYILPDNVENLYIWGYTPKSGNTGVGNALSNLIVGDINTQNLIGMAGNDVLVGGGGSDLFVFGTGSGHDVITDFTSGASSGLDYVRLQGYGLTTFEAVRAAMSQVGTDVVLRLSATDDITFRSTSVDSFTADNFKLPIDMARFRLTFADEFDTLRLQTLGNPATGVWAPEFGFGGFGSKASHYIGYYTGEVQMFVDPAFTGSTAGALGLNPFSVNEGVVSIQARASTAAEKAAMWPTDTRTFDYVSGMLSSVSSFSQTYGYFEMRARLPAGQGAWPCFWLLSTKPGDRSEIDILEARGQLADINNTSLHHTSLAGGQVGSSVFTPGGASAFHTYGLLWDKDDLVWYVDGAEVYRLATPADMNVPMYLVVTLAVGSWAGTPDAASLAASSFDVDYVRAYAPAEAGERINGTSGNDVLTGSAGPDTLIGGLGNDIYVVDHAGDVVMEAVGAGYDLVRTSLLSHVLAENLENLTYVGTGGFSGTGNGLDNVITGGTGADRLDGGLGGDRLVGGAGNDTYVVDNVRDSVVELAGGGYDTQVTSLTKAMAAANVEALIYNGGQAFTGYARVEGTAITGGSGNDTLIGAAGADTLAGGGGNDLLIGGGGGDTFRFDGPGLGVDRIADFQAGIDHITLQASSFGVSSLVDLGFVAGASPQAADSHATLLYDTGTGDLFYDANGGSPADRVQIATLTNKPALALSDFWLV